MTNNLNTLNTQQSTFSEDTSNEIIQVNNLVKHYNGIKAVKGISFSVKRGEIFGFLGPNGAGKTTTINMLCTLTPPTSGDAYINGYNILKQPEEVRRSIGLVFQENTLDNHLTAEENLFLHASLYNVETKDFIKRKIEMFKLFELWERRKDFVNTFSGGMKRRLELARALIPQPKILFLDEPTVGLDPQTRKKIWEYLFNIRKKKNVTIFLTTQYLNEAESCDRVAIIDHGEIIALDTPENLKKMIGGDIITIITNDNEKAEFEVKNKFPHINLKRIGKEIKIEVNNGNRFLPLLIKTLTPQVLSVELRQPTLEDVFLKLTGRQIREENKEDNNFLNFINFLNIFNENDQEN
ncbi:MAG: ATP-binding cassette domain-containing protein [Minisyncoccia bacterium]